MTEREIKTKRMLLAAMEVATSMLNEATEDRDVIIANEFIFNVVADRKRQFSSDALEAV